MSKRDEKSSPTFFFRLNESEAELTYFRHERVPYLFLLSLSPVFVKIRKYVLGGALTNCAPSLMNCKPVTGRRN